MVCQELLRVKGLKEMVEFHNARLLVLPFVIESFEDLEVPAVEDL